MLFITFTVIVTLLSTAKAKNEEDDVDEICLEFRRSQLKEWQTFIREYFDSSFKFVFAKNLYPMFACQVGNNWVTVVFIVIVIAFIMLVSFVASKVIFVSKFVYKSARMCINMVLGIIRVNTRCCTSSIPSNEDEDDSDSDSDISLRETATNIQERVLMDVRAPGLPLQAEPKKVENPTEMFICSERSLA